MLDENTRLKLLRGSDIKIDNEIVIKSHKINYIIDNIGIDKHNEYLRYVVYTPYDMRASLYENGIVYTEIKHWDMFISYVFGMVSNNIREAIMCLISIDIAQYRPKNDKNNKIILESINGNIIDEFKFLYIVDIIREMNGFPKVSSEPKFGNKTALLYDIERHTRRIKKGRNTNNTSLKSIISSVAWSDGSLNINNIWDLTLYQLYDGLNRKVKKERYDNLMFGVYTGNIKYDSINFNKENWFTN